MRERLVPGKLERDGRAHLHGLLGDVSKAFGGSFVNRPVDCAVNNVRTLGQTDSTLIAPIELCSCGVVVGARPSDAHRVRSRQPSVQGRTTCSWTNAARR